ncbi:peptidoglycan DD-metalloendopeptidase family protein [Alishewanella sp. BS5-314]|uniref:murein hydrolase activator EnvC family protein n=1 Tax=Alishewanella sp. BS5-314 TaxID=2755587 RepID=UPI0021BB3DD2|nr:peptidoglycan DD-metalloendopeptidase family protein [Alishewanella sp. BS5-314]MCT8127116.1 peptidoglycan DD-metalloendopeptidase family protein [Alishewanella sp. BS5-314]
MSKRLPYLFAGCFWLSLLSTATSAQQTPQAERELQQLQQQIKQTEQQVRQQRRQLQQAEQRLQAADKALAEAARKLRDTQGRQQRLERESANLNRQQQQLQQQLAEQQQLLAEQLKSAYSLGQHDYSRLLLNQQDTGKLERVLTYYQYFNQARLRQLAQINHTVSELDQVKQQLANQQQQLQTELSALQQQQQQLSEARGSQQASVNELQALLKQQGNQLSYLRQNETTLQNTINELRRLAERNRDLSGLTAGRGKYPWPLRGRVLQRFGQNRQGGLASRGILIQGVSGANVQSIADGRVIYADWLKGYGWVIVVDHGKGFMSLYGHNQSLLKQPGDNVRAGDAIAQVGASGGQADPGLYFEIREKGEAVNPLNWLGAQ